MTMCSFLMYMHVHVHDLFCVLSAKWRGPRPERGPLHIAHHAARSCAAQRSAVQSGSAGRARTRPHSAAAQAYTLFFGLCGQGRVLRLRLPDEGWFVPFLCLCFLLRPSPLRVSSRFASRVGAVLVLGAWRLLCASARRCVPTGAASAHININTRHIVIVTRPTPTHQHTRRHTHT
jgi:hypothetical protein